MSAPLKKNAHLQSNRKRPSSTTVDIDDGIVDYTEYNSDEALKWTW